MVGVSTFISGSNAIEVHVLDGEVLIAKVERETLGPLVTKTGETFERNARGFVVHAIEAGRCLLFKSVSNVQVDETKADTSTDIGLPLAATVEVVERIKGGRRDVNVTGFLNADRVRRHSCLKLSKSVHTINRVELVVTVVDFHFQTEAIVEAVTDTSTVKEAGVDVRVVLDRARNPIFGVVVNLAFEVSTDVATDIPSVLGDGDHRSRRKCGRRCRAQKSFLHTHPLL